jgi:hypothetical protein
MFQIPRESPLGWLTVLITQAIAVQRRCQRKELCLRSFRFELSSNRIQRLSWMGPRRHTVINKMSYVATILGPLSIVSAFQIFNETPWMLHSVVQRQTLLRVGQI